MTKRELPQVIEAEKRLLAAMMLGNAAEFSIIATILSADDFYRAEHKTIYQAMIRVNSSGVIPNFDFVENELKKMGELQRVDRRYLLSLLNYEYSISRAEAFAKLIKDKADLRRLIRICEETLEDAYEERMSAEEILQNLEKKFSAVKVKVNSSDFEPIRSILDRSFRRIQYIYNHPEEMTGVKTSLIELDKVLNGFQKTDLILLAARPSMGKTALALNIAVNAARNGKSVAIFSLEMGKDQLGNRLLSLESGINSLYLNTVNLTEENMINLAKAAYETLPSLKLYIEDSGNSTFNEMRTKVRQLNQKNNLDFVIIDYLQLMKGTRTENRQQEISEISRNLKALAKELNVPILALSQLSRSVEMRAEKKPQLSDLRESGSLEQDADIVMFLYRDEYYNRDDSENENIAELIIAKNRNGPTTNLRLQYQKEVMHFRDLTRAAE